jgi:alcohol dehydrogenase class IV
VLIQPFSLSRLPRILFGAGRFSELGDLIGSFGKCVLIITGGKSFQASAHWERLRKSLSERGIPLVTAPVLGEPSPDLIDAITAQQRPQGIEVVVAIGGGSVLDAGKAVSAMLPSGDAVSDYLEGVGTKTHDGRKVPFIAVPTTPGTGSEATKNAVLGRVGVDGYKRSLRHDNFMPDAALVDPELTLTCPPSVTAACGLDAVTQLLEAYTSTIASPLTNALAWSGLSAAAASLLRACEDPQDLEARTAMAYAALVSGITLANAGLGIVHGLASPIGGMFDIPHGVVCGTLLAEATRVNIEKLKARGEDPCQALEKYAQVASLLGTRNLPEKLEEWTIQLRIPKLGAFGMDTGYIDRIVEATSNKNNPVRLGPEEIREILLNRI